jgi:peptidoglycan/LPS O-acetylase OafA/YrhL
MTFLRRVLTLQAALWGVVGLVLLTVPGALVEHVFDREPGADGTWLRIAGVMAIVLAMLMVLISRRLLEVWWWAWAFAILEAGIATIAALAAVTGDPPVWPWWGLAAVSTVFVLLDLFGIARSEREKPFA